jgi:hypothetical protein
MDKLLRLLLVCFLGMAMFLAYAGVAYAERFERIEYAIEILQSNACQCDYYVKGWDDEGKPYLIGPYNTEGMATEYLVIEREYGTDSLNIITDCECYDK